MKKSNPLVALDRMIDRLRSSTYWLKESAEYKDSSMFKYQVEQNAALLEAVEKAFGKQIEKDKEKEAVS
jgi:hypothetical protein